MKLIHTGFDKWESAALVQVEMGRPFEILGFDLDVPTHRAFWDKVKRSGKFNCSSQPKIKATFLPAN